MKRGIYLLLVSCLLAACSRELSEVAPTLPELTISGTYAPLEGRAPLSKMDINRLVLRELQTRNEFRWDRADDYTLWSAVVRTDSLVSIGYQPKGFTDLDKHIHEIDVNDSEWSGVRNALIQFIVEEEQALYPNKQLQAGDILAFGQKTLPYINVKIGSYETLAKLRRMEEVRYVDPMDYGTESAGRSDSGCGITPDNSIPAADYTTVSPGIKVPWNFYNANIPAAWGVSTGNNIGVGLIDTGISPDQGQLNGNFATGYSTSRYRAKYGTYATGWWWWKKIDGPNDPCGHGTQMAGTICAPRNSTGAAVGVAYEANLISVRGTSDVIINGSNEKDGVSDALVLLGNRSDVKIISMSIGDVFYSGQVADAVRYAYNRGKMLISAAGTSLSWTSWWGVIFPATMSETVAVTGIRDGSSIQRCNTCHSGSQVDFVAVMQRASDTDRTSLTLSMSGNTPARVGGSSVATATTAGIAALIWARNPNMSRSQVLQTMKDASQYYPSRSNEFGWGKIDAAQAVSLVQ